MLSAVTGLRDVQPANRLCADRKERIQSVNKHVLSVQYSAVHVTNTIRGENQLSTLITN